MHNGHGKKLLTVHNIDINVWCPTKKARFYISTLYILHAFKSVKVQKGTYKRMVAAMEDNLDYSYLYLKFNENLLPYWSHSIIPYVWGHQS